MSTTAPAVLETKFQFSDTHPGSSFLGLFLAKRILSLGGRLCTPWVQLIFSVPQNEKLKNKKGEQSIMLLQSTEKGERSVVRDNNSKRKEGLQALFGLGCLGYARLTQTERTGTGYPGKQSKTDWDLPGKGMQSFSPSIRPGLLFLFKFIGGIRVV